MSITCLAEGAQGAAEQAPNALRQGLGPRAPQVRGKAERSSPRGSRSGRRTAKPASVVFCC